MELVASLPKPQGFFDPKSAGDPRTGANAADGRLNRRAAERAADRSGDEALRDPPAPPPAPAAGD